MELITKKSFEDYQKANAEREANGKRVGIILYPAFEVLDVYGPIEMWGSVQDIKVLTVAQTAGAIESAQGVKTIADYSFDDCPKLDIVMVPGGMGTLKELNNPEFISFLQRICKDAEIVTSVCSGSALLAKAGILDGHKATSNKMYFDLAVSQSDKVEWIYEARWVDDGKVVTSSGVSAGMDMALHVISRLYGGPEAEKIAGWTEYIWNSDASKDPFAKPRPKAAAAK